MTKERAIGIWDEFWHGIGQPFPLTKISETAQGTHKNPPEAITYLENGYQIIFTRGGISSCPVTREAIDFPVIFCDDRFLWSLEYIFYVKNGKLPIDEALLAHMREHNFTVPAITAADLPFINEVLTALGFSTYSKVPRSIVHGNFDE